MNMCVKSLADFQQMYPSFINFCQRSRRPTGPLNRAPLCTTGDFAKIIVMDLKYKPLLSFCTRSRPNCVRSLAERLTQILSRLWVLC
jgi:hypothetical protein